MDDKDDTARVIAKYEALASSLQYFDGVGGATPYRKYGNFWYPAHLLAPMLAARDTFVARSSDIILATTPKAGTSRTTWLKALVFAIAHRHRHAPDDLHHPLLSSSPHDLVPFVHTFYEDRHSIPRLDAMSTPRVLALHSPFSALPNSVVDSKCRVIYLCRDPKDVVVSFWHVKEQSKSYI